MDDQDIGSRSGHGPESEQRTEPVRSRWTPKPEQILILESIFNSGMVNPPKDETVRIRKLLEKFGSVGDANVFYWFQNRRSRSRRRQRQIQASLTGAGDQNRGCSGGSGGGMQYENSTVGGFGSGSLSYHQPMNTSSCLGGSSSSSSGFGGENHEGNMRTDDFFSYSGIQEYEQNPMFCPYDNASNFLNYQSGVITVFINGLATEIGKGPLDMRATFGGDFLLFHSSGVPIQVNEYGFLVQSLQQGESYFLVPRHT